MISKNKLTIGFLLFFISSVNAQYLQVIQSDDNKKVDRNAADAQATIIFDSKVKNLIIDNGTADNWYKPSENIYIYVIDTKKDLENGYEYSHRNFFLKSPETSEFILEIEEILPKQVLYYTVLLKKHFPTILSAEWLLNDRISKGIRIGFGGRYGFFIGGTLGDYRPSGDKIEEVSSDCDLSYAKKRGYIRTTIFGGFRMGLLYKNDFIMFSYFGVGYGEHGCQWENQSRLENSKYFYSDYMQGVNLNVGVNLHYSFTILSLGADMIMSQGKFVIDWQLGLGVYLDVSKLSKNRI